MIAAKHTDNKSQCKVCKREVAVGLQRGVRVGEKWLVWRECAHCFLQDPGAQE